MAVMVAKTTWVRVVGDDGLCRASDGGVMPE
jgi:hypothetical protein